SRRFWRRRFRDLQVRSVCLALTSTNSSVLEPKTFQPAWRSFIPGGGCREHGRRTAAPMCWLDHNWPLESGNEWEIRLTSLEYLHGSLESLAVEALKRMQ